MILYYNKVIFPLLENLLVSIDSLKFSPSKLEEIRIRAIALLSKTFLQYLSTITHNLTNFTQLWINILKYMEIYMKIENSELLVI